MSTEPHISLVPQIKSPDTDPISDIGEIGSGLATSSSDGNRDAWLLDSIATDHVIFDDIDFTTRSTPRHTCVENANGVVSLFTGAGIVSQFPSQQLSHTLLIPLFSHKLLPVGQVTEELNCVVLICCHLYLLQDIHTKEIIGRAIKRGASITWMKSVRVMFFTYAVMDGNSKSIYRIND